MNPKITPKALNCPNCGGAVMSDKTSCEFCRSRLKTVGCSACLSVMFLGSKFCQQCGAKAVLANIVQDENAGDCPRCKNRLQVVELQNTNIRECGKCGGFWADTETFEDLCSNKEQQAAILGFISSDAHPHAHPAAISYVPCPECGNLMNRSNFAKTSGVILDICREHGVWFDADELPKIIDFITRGGLAHSREKEKIALESERSRLREEQNRLARMERRTGGGRFDRPDSGDGWGSIISKLLG